MGHARTRDEGYRPPAHWDRIAGVRAAAQIPVIANGDIWNRDDALRCRAASGCDSLMLGRGMVCDPGLALAIVRPQQAQPGWTALLELIGDFWRLIETRVEPRHRAGRLKQWLNFLRRRHPEAQQAYAAVRTVSDPVRLERLLFGEPAGTISASA